MKNKTFKTGALVFGLALLSSTQTFAQSEGKGNQKPPSFSELLKKLDANEDGKLSENEVDGPLKEQFATIDADKDGFITEAEMKPKAKEAKSEKKSKGQGKGMPTYTELLEQMDADKDGKLSKSEVKGPLKNDFSKVDTDKDGFLSEAELKNAPKPERPQRR
ncbi:EF-hand domain-containing protein [Algibacter lectus]|uniref:EF-hand domain-containing protein n=1 Tax=Algibacter lectus TaxID=221126 RepID=UPI0024959306|nr:EF-hand domain-containing protein [Algibacter lectus]